MDLHRRQKKEGDRLRAAFQVQIDDPESPPALNGFALTLCIATWVDKVSHAPRAIIDVYRNARPVTRPGRELCWRPVFPTIILSAGAIGAEPIRK